MMIENFTIIPYCKNWLRKTCFMKKRNASYPPTQNTRFCKMSDCYYHHNNTMASTSDDDDAMNPFQQHTGDYLSRAESGLARVATYATPETEILNVSARFHHPAATSYATALRQSFASHPPAEDNAGIIINDSDAAAVDPYALVMSNETPPRQRQKNCRYGTACRKYFLVSVHSVYALPEEHSHVSIFAHPHDVVHVPTACRYGSNCNRRSGSFLDCRHRILFAHPSDWMAPRN
jgi:hypothetical protein